MAYCGISDITAVLAEAEVARLTDDISGEIINTLVVDNAISAAGELIDGYLRSKFSSLPLSPIPKLITNISVDLAIYYLHQRRYRTNMPESVESQYKNQVKILEQIQKGFISLGIEPVSTETKQTGGVRVNKTSTDRYFNSQLMTGF